MSHHEQNLETIDNLPRNKLSDIL